MAKYKKVRSLARRRRRKTGLRRHVYSAVESIGRQGMQEKIQDALEAERDEILGRSTYERLTDGRETVYRNGHHKTRCLVCGSGAIDVRVPRLETPYESKLVPRYERMSPEMKHLLPELYLHGLSTGDMELALGWLLGEGAPLSPGTILRLKATWEQEYRLWQKRPLEKEYLYVWADGIYPKGGPLDESLCLLVVLGVTRDGHKELLALAEGYRESEESWTALLADLKSRGVGWIGLVIGDGIKGLWKAVREKFPRAYHQRCWVHRMRNILDKVPDKAHDEVLAHLRRIYYAASREEARKVMREFVASYRTLYPKAVDCLLETGNLLLTYFLYPREHWKSIKTTNPIESIFSTVKLRTKAARRLRTRVSAVCLVYQLLKTSEKRLRKINGPRLVAKTIDSMRNQSNNTRVRRAA
jgi:transposase-like protein